MCKDAVRCHLAPLKIPDAAAGRAPLPLGTRPARLPEVNTSAAARVVLLL